MPLTELKIRNARPESKPYKLFDGGGLFLLVHPSGSKYWRLKYRFNGSEKLLAIGSYPSITTIKAREKREDAKRQLREGKDPSAIKRAEKIANLEASANTFKIVAEEWIGSKENEWTEGHAKTVRDSLEQNVYPDLGQRPIKEITAPDLLACFRKIEKRGALDIAGRVFQRCADVFGYALATNRCLADDVPQFTILKKALKKPSRKHFAALDQKDLPEFLKKLRAYSGTLVTTTAVRVLMMTFVRTGELRFAKWPEFDLDNGVWTIPGERMKGKKTEVRPDHVVPLSSQVVALLRELHALTGNNPEGYVFPNPVHGRGGVISENCVLQCIYRMGYKSKMTGHGFRAVASTVLNEQGWDADAVERQLAHTERDKVRKAYHRAKYMDERKRMMQHWADYLDGIENGAKVIPLHKIA